MLKETTIIATICWCCVCVCVCVCVCIYIAFQCGVKLMIILKLKVICVKFYALEYFFFLKGV